MRDPLGEARWSFVEPALAARPPRGARWRILEVGFGRGLNSAVALAELARRGYAGRVEVLGLEPRPELLAPWPAVPEELADSAPWWGKPPGTSVAGGRFEAVVEVRAAAAPEALASEDPFDWVFLDLFSPARHPEDWRPGLGAALAAAAAPGCALTSYCCARSLRDELAATRWLARRVRRLGRRDCLLARFGAEAGLPASGSSITIGHILAHHPRHPRHRKMRSLLLLLLVLSVPGCAMPGGSEWLWILLIAVLLFGGAKLPGLMRSMGAGITEFKRGLKEGEGSDAEGEGDGGDGSGSGSGGGAEPNTPKKDGGADA